MLTEKEIQDINDSWVLALFNAGIDPAIVHDCHMIVEDYIVNHMGED